jgi:hypothetical protein
MKSATALTSGTPMRVGRGTRAPVVRAHERHSDVISRPLGIVALLLFWQSGLLLVLLWGFIELGLYAGIHFAGCLCLTAWLFGRSGAAAGDTVPLQIVAWSAFAGPFGAFVAVALLFRPLSVRPEVMAGNDADSLKADGSKGTRVERMHLALLDRRVRLDRASQIRPLMDVIVEGSQPEKLEALGVVYRRYDADLNPVLKRALQDPDTPVRVLAATVTAQLHATFSRNIGDRQAAADATPNLAQSWRDLADARLVYADSGLLDAPRARAEVELAIGDLLRAAGTDPDDRDTASRLDRARRQFAAWR